MDLENGNNIDKLKQKLYKKGQAFDFRIKRKQLREKDGTETMHDWEQSTGDIKMLRKTKFNLMKTLVIFSVVFLLVSSFIVAYFLFGGANIISSRNIDIQIKGSQYTEAGKIIDLNIEVENKNSTALEFSDLIVEYPEGTLVSEDSSKIKTRDRYTLGRIDQGKNINQKISFVLLGNKEEKKTIKAILEYRLENSNAIFAKSVEFVTEINSSPIGISISMPKEARSNQEMTIDVEIVSNSEITLRDLVLQMEYPPGFQYKRSVPQTINGDNRWSIGDLDSSQKRTIKIVGVAEGQDLDEKAIHATVGSMKNENTFIAYTTQSETFTIRKALLDISLFINGKDVKENIVSSGQYVKGELVWKNNLPISIRDAVIETEISGNSINLQSISVSNGFYKYADRNMIWNSSSMPDLRSINPGETGKVQFSFSILDPLPVNTVNDKNFTVNLKAKISGISTSEDSGDTEIKNNTSKEVKVSGRTQLATRAIHYSGAFNNTGPMPPKVGKETTYTIVWAITNSYNDVSSAIVKSSLPSYVRWLGKISPENEDITFNEATGEIIWKSGAVSSGTGTLRPAKEVSFQVGLTPSFDQVGDSPTLVFGTNLEATDDYTNVSVSDTDQSLTTRLTSDPKFDYSKGSVVE